MTHKLLPGSLRSAPELLQKLRRDAALLEDEVTSDRLFNFVVTGYSLIDWIKHDPTVPAAAKVGSEIDSLYHDPWLTLCGDLATAAKHFELTTRKPTASGVTAARGWGVGRFGKGGYGVGEEEIRVHLPDGTAHDVFALVEGVLRAWKNFFTRHSLAGA